MNPERLIIFSDGGAFNNPGPAGIGLVFVNLKGEKLWQFSKFIGFKTNNQAEYEAVIEALKLAKTKFQAKQVQILLDSKLICEQLKGNFRIKNNQLKSLNNLAKNLQLNFEVVFFEHIPREQNKIADFLVKKAIKNYLKTKNEK